MNNTIYNDTQKYYISLLSKYSIYYLLFTKGIETISLKQFTKKNVFIQLRLILAIIIRDDPTIPANGNNRVSNYKKLITRQITMN